VKSHVTHQRVAMKLISFVAGTLVVLAGCSQTGHEGSSSTGGNGSSTVHSDSPAAASAPPATASPVNLMGTAASALQACVRVTAPSVPDGSRASLNQMEAASTAFRAYDAATNSFIKCVDSTVDQVAKQFAGVASESDLQSLKTFGVSIHNTAVDQEQAVVDKFNSQIRTYKAKHAKP
jgi:hypothetical protein